MENAWLDLMSRKEKNQVTLDTASTSTSISTVKEPWTSLQAQRNQAREQKFESEASQTVGE